MSLTLLTYFAYEEHFIQGVAKDLLLCAAFAWLLWAPLGRWLLHVMGKDKLPDPQSLCIALGMGGWGLLVLLIGMAGVLYASLVVAAAASLFLLLRLHKHSIATNPRCHPHSSLLWRDRLFIFAFCLVSGTCVILILASALAPELAFDALNVHLPYARDSTASHRIGFAPNNWNSSMPALPLMSYAAAFLFSGLTLAKLFNACCYLVCGGVIYFFVCRGWGSLHGAAAALLFWSSPVILYEATTALVDLPLTLYSAVTVLSLLEWTRSDERPMLWLSAVGLGLALGCKYYAAFWIPPVTLILVWHALKVKSYGSRRLIFVLLQYAVIVAVLFLPWLVRSWYYTGNPIFPVANRIFKSPYFTPAMEDAAMAAYQLEGVGRSWRALLKLPWTVSFHPRPFRGTLGVVFLPGIALSLLWRRSRNIYYGLLLVGTYFYEWAITPQEIRFLLPLVPVLAMMTSVGFLGGAPHDSRENASRTAGKPAGNTRLVTYVGACMILAAAILNLPSIYPLWTREWTYLHSYQSPFRYLLGKESTQEFLRRDVPSIYVYDFMNEELTQQDRVLLLNDASQLYSRVPTLYSYTVEGDGLLLQETEEAVLRKLRESRITHVLLNYNGIAPLPGVAPRKGVFFFLDREFQARHLEPVYSKNNVVLCRLRG